MFFKEKSVSVNLMTAPFRFISREKLSRPNQGNDKSVTYELEEEFYRSKHRRPRGRKK